jgi:hypothetical protein
MEEDEEGNATGTIMLVRFNFTEAHRVDIATKTNEYAIIRQPEEFQADGISIYDEYVINIEKIPEGRRMR